MAPPHPPLGLHSWSRDATALAVLLDAAAGDLANLALVADQIPSAETLPLATPVVVLGEPAHSALSWRRFGLRKRKVARAPRCGALLVRGYVDIGAGLDRATGGDIVWGWSRRAN